MRSKTLLAALAGPLTLAFLIAAGPAAESGSALPEAQTRNGVTFLTGGVGAAQHDAILKHADDYDLWVTLTAPDGKYLSRMNVTLENESGATVLETEVNGPFLLAKLDPGHYRIHATGKDRSAETRTVEVPESGQARVFVAMEETG